MVPTGFSCNKAREYVSLDLDGELSELDRERLRMHLAQCAACSKYAHDVTATTALLRNAPLEPVPVRVTPDCEQARQDISLDLDGELSEAGRERLDTHLAQCSACAAFAHDLRAMTALLRSAPLASLSEPLTLATTRRPRRRRIRVGAGAGVAVAAMLVLGVGISNIGDSAQAPTSVPFDDSALGERQNWDGIQSRPIALRRAAPGPPAQSDPA